MSHMYVHIDKDLFYTFRKSKNSSMDDFAKIIGVSSQAIYSYTVKSILPVHYIYKIADGFGLKITDLLFINDRAFLKVLKEKPGIDQNECGDLLYVLRGDVKEYIPDDKPAEVKFQVRQLYKPKEINPETMLSSLNKEKDKMGLMHEYLLAKISFFETIRKIKEANISDLDDFIDKDLSEYGMVIV